MISISRVLYSKCVYILARRGQLPISDSNCTRRGGRHRDGGGFCKWRPCGAS